MWGAGRGGEVEWGLGDRCCRWFQIVCLRDADVGFMVYLPDADVGFIACLTDADVGFLLFV